MKTHFFHLLLGIALALTTHPVCGGVIPFFDDFDDDHADGNPVLWHHAGDVFDNGGRREVIDGDFIIGGNGYSAMWVDDTADTADVSLRASVRFLDQVGTWMFAARSTADANGFYWGGINSDGIIWIGDWAAAGEGIVDRAQIQTQLDPFTEDVSLRMDVFDVEDGVEVSLFAWSEGQPVPSEPQLRYTDESKLFSEGMIGMFTQLGEPTTVAVDYYEASTEPIEDAIVVLQPGDVDQDFDFDQLDLVRVSVAGKYLTGAAATWGEGDWDGAPGGRPGNPPAGNGLFDELDVISALAAGVYLTGPYSALLPEAVTPDHIISLGYDAGTGDVFVDVPVGMELSSLRIDSASGIFTGDDAENLGGSFDNESENKIFKATFAGSFGSLGFGNVAQPGLGRQFLLNDLTTLGSLAGGGDLGAVELIYIPEPSTISLIGLAACLSLIAPVGRRFRMNHGTKDLIAARPDCEPGSTAR